MLFLILLLKKFHATNNIPIYQTDFAEIKLTELFESLDMIEPTIGLNDGIY